MGALAIGEPRCIVGQGARRGLYHRQSGVFNVTNRRAILVKRHMMYKSRDALLHPETPVAPLIPCSRPLSLQTYYYYAHMVHYG